VRVGECVYVHLRVCDYDKYTVYCSQLTIVVLAVEVLEHSYGISAS